MPPPLPPTASGSNSNMERVFRFSIFRGTLKFWTIIHIIIGLVVLSVHLYALNVEQSRSLPLSNLLLDLKRQCDPDSVELMLAREAASGASRPSSISTLLSRNTPPASLFALRVWVEEAALLPTVHTILSTVNERLIENAPAALTQLRRQYTRQVMLHRLVRFDPAPEDLWLSNDDELEEDQTVTEDEPVNASDAAAAAVAPSTASSSKAPLKAFRSLEHARSLLTQRASFQQLGLPTLQHAFTPDPTAELQMMSVSLIRLPAALHTSYIGWLAAPSGTDAERAHAAAQLANNSASDHYGTRCERFDAHQFYCVLPPRTSSPSSSSVKTTDKWALQTALTSVLSEDMDIRSFRDPNLVQLFFYAREHAGCVHAYRSVAKLQQSMRDYPDMKVPSSVYPILTELKQLVRLSQYVLAARAADALQYHPLLTPQLYIPFDHNIVSHILILLPVISLLLLCLRFARDRFRVNRQLKKGSGKKRTAATVTPPPVPAEPTVAASPEAKSSAPAQTPLAPSKPKPTRQKQRKED